MSTCNFFKEYSMLDDILDEDSIRPRLGTVWSGQVDNEGYYNGVKLSGGTYFPVGPCVNITGGVSHRVACSKNNFLSLWQSPNEECDNPVQCVN